MNCNTTNLRFVCIIGCLLNGIFLGHAQTTNETARVLDACGGWSTNAACSTIMAVCQSSPVGVTTGATHINCSGFLESFVLYASLDHDGDGIVDENDPDDDNDGLTDVQELEGTAFSPVATTNPLLSDSDGDGMIDWAEAVAGTNPLDAQSLLRFTLVDGTAGGVSIAWKGREGRMYDLVRGGSVWELSASPVFVTNVTAGSGEGIWHETQTTALDPDGTTNAFYRVLITP